MTIIEVVRTYLATCPLLAGGKLHVDFLPPEAATYSVDVVPVKPITKQYIDGSSNRQFLFVLATRAYYGDFIRQQLDNLAFFEQFEEWLDTQNRVRNYPDLGIGRTVQRLEVTTSGYVFAPDTETARYQIQCRLSYYQKGER
ncbi:MAG: hypothetical protein PHD67_09075 [Oscillospiraceae bacterium]|nr:hypothetical protein [Oscillospiraceae bacterium]